MVKFKQVAHWIQQTSFFQKMDTQFSLKIDAEWSE